MVKYIYNDYVELIERYKDEVGKDLVINDFNIKDVQLKLPSRKHYWAARLIDAKIAHFKLIKRKKSLKETLVKRIIGEAPVRLTQQTAEIAAESSEDIQKIVAEIKDYEFVIEYLEKIEKIMSGMGFDIANVIKIIAMEQL
jgi:DNA-dependent RNA polymerase auxiliary subunit epsilon